MASDDKRNFAEEKAITRNDKILEKSAVKWNGSFAEKGKQMQLKWDSRFTAKCKRNDI